MSKFLRWLHWGYGGSHFDSRNFWLLLSIYAWGAKVVQWWGHLPLTRVALVGILVLVSYICWGYCWFCPLLCEVFLCLFQFSLNTNTSEFQFDLECTDMFSEFSRTCKCSMGKQNTKSYKKNSSLCLKLKRREVVNCIRNFSGSCQKIIAGSCSFFGWLSTLLGYSFD